VWFGPYPHGVNDFNIIIKWNFIFVVVGIVGEGWYLLEAKRKELVRFGIMVRVECGGMSIPPASTALVDEKFSTTRTSLEDAL